MFVSRLSPAQKRKLFNKCWNFFHKGQSILYQNKHTLSLEKIVIHNAYLVIHIFCLDCCGGVIYIKINIGYLIIDRYFSIGLDREYYFLYSLGMKISIRYRQLPKQEVNNLGKDMVDFANFQFKRLVKKNLGVPVKAFRL